MNEATPSPSLLIVNADDFGYFRCVSRGIIESHRKGIVTASGVLANSPGLEEDLGYLRTDDRLDLGVHLNVTDGIPLASEVRRRLRGSGGRFAGKIAFTRLFLGGRRGRALVEAEWRAQIERCLGLGLRVQFLNSHEHIHMLPPLFELIQYLARDYAIPYVRFPSPEGETTGLRIPSFRDGAIGVLARLNVRRLKMRAPYFLGLGASGKLSVDYLRTLIGRLVPGRVYELMCHPGRFDQTEVRRRDLIAYHRWEQELAALTSEAVVELCKPPGIRLVGYRDLASHGESAELVRAV